MADTRTLKLSLLADVNKFLDGMDKADKSTQTFSGKIGKYSKAMAASFAVAGAAAAAYALKLGVDGVKAAVEDEASQVRLAQALKNTTNATDGQIASIEDYIKKQQISFGIADTKLRPALANLARATGDLTEAQTLNNLAIDISAATGKDLESVSLALSKAYNGNLGALTKLGVPLDASIIKSKDFGAATDELQKLFGGSAQANTRTYAGQLAILSERFSEIKEDLGVKLIPIMKSFLEQVNLVAMGFGGEDPNKGLSNKVKQLDRDLGGGPGGAYNLGKSLKQVADAFGALFGALSGNNASVGNDNLQNFANAMQNVAGAINAVASAYAKLDKFTKSKGYQATLDAIFGTKEGGFGTSIFNPFGTNFAGAGSISGAINGSRAAGGSVMAGQPYRVGEFGPEMFVPSGSGSIRSVSAGGGTTIIMNGIIDGESARRSIEKLLQDSSRRTGAINLVGATL
jgi:hypothetical protein